MSLLTYSHATASLFLDLFTTLGHSFLLDNGNDLHKLQKYFRPGSDN